MPDSRETAERFGVEYERLPHIVYIHKGHWYRYQVLRDEQNSVVVNLDDLVKFAEDREYLDIPEAFPNDFGKIPEPTKMYKYFYDLMKHEVDRKGGLVNFLMLKDDDGKVKVLAFVSIYGSLTIILISIVVVFRDAKQQLTSTSSNQTHSHKD